MHWVVSDIHQHIDGHNRRYDIQLELWSGSHTGIQITGHGSPYCHIQHERIEGCFIDYH